MRYLRLWVTFLKFSLKQLAAYRADFFFRLFSMILMMTIMYFVLSLPFEYTDQIAGWHRVEVLALISVYYMSNGITWALFREGIGELENLVKTGDFDGKLLKPIKTSFLVSFFRIDISRFGDVVISGSFLVYLIWKGYINIDILLLFSALVTFVCGVWIVSKIFLIINSLSFWVTETYLDHVANPLLVVAKYPVDIWPQNFQRILYWFLPIAFVSTVPTAILIGKLDWSWFIGALVFAGIWSLFAKLFWRFALRHYSSTGS